MMAIFFRSIAIGSLILSYLQIMESTPKCGYEAIKEQYHLTREEGSLELPEACEWDAPFQCITVHNRLCIRTENFCDLVADCLDGSDEIDCRPKEYGEFFPRLTGTNLKVFKLLTFASSDYSHSNFDVHQFINQAPVDENYQVGNPWRWLQDYQISPFINFTFRNLATIHKTFYDEPGVMAAYIISLSKANNEDVGFGYRELNNLVLLMRYLNEAINKVILRADKYQVPYYM
uniref:Scol-LDLA n=1 Tax=Scolopendra viridis TaxID=118503 RepID=A0A4D5R9I0_SCOVI